MQLNEHQIAVGISSSRDEKARRLSVIGRASSVLVFAILLVQVGWTPTALAGDLRRFVDMDQAYRTISPSVARVFCLDPAGFSSGTAFLVDRRGYLLTNWHVISTGEQHEDLSDREPCSRIVVLFYPGRKYKAIPVTLGINREKDLALIKLIGKPDRPALQLTATPPAIGRTIYTLGFPFAADQVAGGITIEGPFGRCLKCIVKASESDCSGSCKRYLQAEYKSGEINKLTVQAERGNRRVVQTDIAFNSGNSGGPVLDLCGRVVGVATAVLRSAALTNIAVDARDAHRLVRVGGARLQLQSGVCSKKTRLLGGDRKEKGRSWMWLLFGAAFVGGLIAMLLIWRRGAQPSPVEAKRVTQPTAHRSRASPAYRKASSASRTWALFGVSGPYAGERIPVDAQGVVIGRDPDQCSLVLPADTEGTSRKHVWIRVNNDRLWLKDEVSKMGTYVEGNRARLGEWTPLQDGEQVRLGDSKVVFTVRQRRG